MKASDVVNAQESIDGILRRLQWVADELGQHDPNMQTIQTDTREAWASASSLAEAVRNGSAEIVSTADSALSWLTNANSWVRWTPESPTPNLGIDGFVAAARKQLFRLSELLIAYEVSDG